MKKAMIVILGLLVGTPVFAGVTEGAGTWSGLGTAFGLDGKANENFSIDMVSTAVGSSELDSTITVTVNGQKTTVQQTLKDAGDNKFEIVSSQGNGGGYCFGKGLCEAYMGTYEHGYAVTIVFDGPDSRRMLVTELENGKATGFVRESLERIE